MKNVELLRNLRARGIVDEARVEQWRGLAELLAAMDGISREGACAIVKVDGFREGKKVYTVVLSGGTLGEQSYRKDGDDLSEMLQEAIKFYDDKVWSNKSR